MTTPSTPRLIRSLGVRDLVLMNIAAIVGLRWLSNAAQIGPASLTLWLIALLIFLLPMALAVLELSSRLPAEGGLYVWTKSAFGDHHGFIAGWSYWVSNLVFLPSALLFGAGALAHLFTDPSGLAENSWYNGAVCLGVLWLATLANITGLDRAKWLQNIGALATWVVASVLLVAAGYSMWNVGSATPITTASLAPDLGSLAAWSTLAGIAFAYVGLELGPILGGEIREPRKTIPRATLISCLLIALIYLAGTAALLVALPTAKIHLITGIPQALAAVGERVGLPSLGPIMALLLALGSFGSVSAWVTGTARLPFVVGVDRYLPAMLSRQHSRFGTPHIALLTQATLTTLVLVAGLAGTTIREAYTLLLDMTLVLTFIPLLYLFAALPVMRWREQRAGGSIAPEIWRAPGGFVGSVIIGGTGFATTLLAIVTSIIPPADNAEPMMFLIKVVGGCALMVAVGMGFYWRGRV
ncbi:MAG: amino acid permease [Betaproteobacteria bacterium]|nr:amino acid permease [Betaproteobacteria bacterium]